MAKQSNRDESGSEVLSHPESWKTGDEPMTTAQRSYLETLSREAGEPFDPNESLTKAEAALRIEDLQRKTGRGGAQPGANQTTPRRSTEHGSSHYQDRPTDDGKYGDGGEEPTPAQPPRRTSQ